MFGLAYLSAAALYFSLLFLVVRFAWRKGKAQGGGNSKALGFAFLGFLGVYLPVFWNWIPVALTHRSLCNLDAGFTAYVTPEQWATENNNSLSRLIGMDLDEISDSKSRSKNISQYRFFGGLLVEETTTDIFHRYGVEFRRNESKTIDGLSNKTLTRRVNYSVGDREDIRVWLTYQSCFPSDATQPSDQGISFIEKLKEQVK